MNLNNEWLIPAYIVEMAGSSALWEMRPNWGFIKEAEKIGASENKESGQLCSQ